MTPGPRGEESAPLEAWDRAHVWHPFTPHSVYADEDPLMVVAAEGCELIDVDGKRYLDGVSSIWCTNLGHRRPELDAALAEQAGRVAHATFLGSASEPGVVLAKRLAEAAPGDLTRVFYSDDGSTAVEAALKIAVQFQQQTGAPERDTFLTLGNAYHGDTVGAVSLGGIPLFHERYRAVVFETAEVAPPACYRCPWEKDPATCSMECVDGFRAALAAHGPRLAAVVLESGFQGAGGIVPLPEVYLAAVTLAAQEAGALVILDEVASGMGRTGHLFACEAEGVEPDLLCLAKGLTGGMLPLAATLATERVFEAFLGPPEEGRTFFHGHTFTGNALGSAVALAVLDVLEDGGVLEGVAARAGWLAGRLEELIGLPGVGDVRRHGLMAGVELVADRDTREPYPPEERRGMAVCSVAREHGVFLRPLGDVIVLCPPLTISEEDIGRLVDAVAAGVREVCADGV